MNNDDARHLRREPRVMVKAAACTVVSLTTLVAVYSIATSDRGPVETVVLLGVALFIGFLAALGAFISLRAERHFHDIAVVAGLVLGTLPLALILNDFSTSHEQTRPGPTTPTSTAPNTTISTTSTAATTTVATTTTAPPPQTTTAATTPASTDGPPTSTGETPPQPHQLRMIGDEPPTCLDTPSAEPGSQVWVSPCDDTITMYWEPTATGQIRGLGGDSCITLALPYDPEGNEVIVAPCDGGDGQNWTRDGVQIRNEKGGCLDVDARGDRHVQIWKCDGTAEQRWLPV